MEKWNSSHVTGFLMLGLTDDPQAKIVIFVTFLVIYVFTVSGNVILITVCVLEPRLHTPMYFFICNLSFLDTLYSSVFVPNILIHLFVERWSISFSGCATQMFAYMALACVESVLLAVMAFDRYVAICLPLHYSSMMNSLTCTKLVVACWVNALLFPIPVTAMALQLPLCGRNVFNHFFCDVMTLIKMACADTSIIRAINLLAAAIACVTPLLIICLSYVNIILAILRIRSSEGRKKAFSTCSSHLINISLMYGVAIFLYMKPMQQNSENQEKIIAVFYTIGPPLWNPIIYSLRNKDIIKALQKPMNR